MPKNNLFHAVLFKQLREQRIFLFTVKGRIMYQRDFPIPLLHQPVRIQKRQAETFRFTQVQFLVLLGVSQRQQKG